MLQLLVAEVPVLKFFLLAAAEIVAKLGHAYMGRLSYLDWSHVFIDKELKNWAAENRGVSDRQSFETQDYLGCLASQGFTAEFCEEAKAGLSSAEEEKRLLQHLVGTGWDGWPYNNPLNSQGFVLNLESQHNPASCASGKRKAGDGLPSAGTTKLKKSE